MFHSAQMQWMLAFVFCNGFLELAKTLLARERYSYRESWSMERDMVIATRASFPVPREVYSMDQIYMPYL